MSKVQTGQWTMNGPSVQDILHDTTGKRIEVTIGCGWYTKSTQTTYIGSLTRIDDKSFDLAINTGNITLSFLDVEMLQVAKGIL